MRATLAAGALAAVMLVGLPLSAHALTGAAPALPMVSGVTPVAQGCGPGFHRGPYGGCRANRWYGPRRWGPGPRGHRCFWRYGRRICRW